MFKDYFSNASLAGDDNEESDVFGKTGDSKNIYDKDPTKTVQKTWTLKRILDCAINNNLDKQGFSLEIDNKIIPLEKMVSSWDGVTKQQNGVQGFFWGYLQSSDNEIWLNSDKKYPYNSFSIKLNEQVKKRFWLSMGKIKGNWKNGVPAIVFGELKWVQSGKIYVEINDLTRLYINRRVYKSNSN